MHPNVFLKSFWRAELKPQVFVAMSFAPAYNQRFNLVIAPAIEAILVGDIQLKACRVDTSKSGDSILTDIMDGIAHSQMILADVSTVGIDAKTNQPYRNGNVLYEVGVALACRQSQEVLLIRDDHDRFLFDVSTIPHLTIDFSNLSSARQRLHEELIARLKERNFVNDARVKMALAGLSAEEVTMLRYLAKYSPDFVWGRKDTGTIDFIFMVAIPRLLDKGVIQLVGRFNQGHPAYQLTQLGFVVAQMANSGLREFRADPVVSTTVSDSQSSEPPDGEQVVGPGSQ
jgi:hypothetical protein